jgi:ABC-2 type transport system ATP-binding protein
VLPSQQPLLQTEHLTKAYGQVKAVTDISFRLYPGELVALLGENGAGKTTTIQMIAGLLTPDQGTILIDGQQISPRELKRQVGYMPEAPFLYPTLSGQEFLEFIGGLHGFSRHACRQRAHELLELLDLQDVAQRRIRGYSQGMRRRLVLCATLFHKPRLLFLDEPLNGIDPPGIVHVKTILAALSQQGCSILISTHLLDIAERLCQRAIILSHGHILADDGINTLQQHAHENTLEQVFTKLIEAK